MSRIGKYKELRNALASVAADKLRVDVITSVTPTGISTEAKQDTMITALQLIDDLRNALGSVNTDDLQVDVKTITVARTTQTMIDAVVFDTAAETYTSAALDISAYREFCLLLSVDVTLAPTDIYFDVLLSDDNITYYKLMNGPFGDLRYEDTAGDLLEAVVGRCLAPWMKIKATSSGCDGTNKFTITAKVVLVD